ncbi:MAG: choice-of-anchor tandem repeat GloVer-containing protein [Candidatus Sulfotelmatobacter sp.]
MRKPTCLLVTVILLCSFSFAQKYSVIYNFEIASGPSSPVGNLVFDRKGNLYGVASSGGANVNTNCSLGCGVVYQLSRNADGSWDETDIYNFCSNLVDSQCDDGQTPSAGLVMDTKGNLYGTTAGGGAVPNCFYGKLNGCGTVFELSPPSIAGGAWAETILYTFCKLPSEGVCRDGVGLFAQLAIDSAGNLYGTTAEGGTGQRSGPTAYGGTVFVLSNHSGVWQHTVLYNFCSLGQGSDCPDGSFPIAGVTLGPSGDLYGTTNYGGSADEGTVYKLSKSANGATETVLYSFSSYPAYPQGIVSLDPTGSHLYSTLLGGGTSNGAAFQLNIEAGLIDIYPFDGVDGSQPEAGVLFEPKSGVFYGTTAHGGKFGLGALFQIDSNGKETVLYNFCARANCSDGFSPRSTLIADQRGKLYGTTLFGGDIGSGVVFKLTP